MCTPSAYDQFYFRPRVEKRKTRSGRGEDNKDFYHVYLHSRVNRSVARSRSELVRSST